MNIIPDDWGLSTEKLSLARIYKVRGGPQNEKWFWAVQVYPDGTMGNGGTGYAATGREAREACEARLPEEIKAALKREQ